MTIGAMLRRDIPPADLGALAADIDGPFEELWIVEDLPYAGGIAQMAQVLATTRYAKVGHGIAPSPFRNPVALAMEWSALATMHPGRVITGIGHGVQEWMSQVGAAVDSPLTLLEETIDCVKSLLAGEEVNASGRYVNVDGVKLMFPPSPAPPLLAGVTGPRSLRLAGARADGVILPEGWGPEDVAAARLKVARGAAEDRRDGDAGPIDGEGNHGAGGPGPHVTVFAAFHVGSLDHLGPPPDGADTSWLAAAPDGTQVAEQLHSLIEAGADSVILMPIGPSPVHQLELAVSHVLPDLAELARR